MRIFNRQEAWFLQGCALAIQASLECRFEREGVAKTEGTNFKFTKEGTLEEAVYVKIFNIETDCDELMDSSDNFLFIDKRDITIVRNLLEIIDFNCVPNSDGIYEQLGRALSWAKKHL